MGRHHDYCLRSTGWSQMMLDGRFDRNGSTASWEITPQQGVPSKLIRYITVRTSCCIVVICLVFEWLTENKSQRGIPLCVWTSSSGGKHPQSNAPTPQIWVSSKESAGSFESLWGLAKNSMTLQMGSNNSAAWFYIDCDCTRVANVSQFHHDSPGCFYAKERTITMRYEILWNITSNSNSNIS